MIAWCCLFLGIGIFAIDNRMQQPSEEVGIGLGIQADFLYLQFSTPKMLFAAEVDAGTNTTQGDLYSSEGKWRPGVDLKLSYAYQTGREMELSLGWYYIQAQFDRAVSSSSLSPYFVTGFYAPTAASATNDTHINLNIFDVLIAKTYHPSPYISLRPYGGFSMEFVRGRGETRFVADSGTFRAGVSQADFSQNVDYDGYGIKFGSHGDICLPIGFLFYGDLSGRFFYGNTSASMKLFENADRENFSAAGNYDHDHGVFLLDALLGIAWEATFNEGAQLLNIHAGYRTQAFYPGWLEMTAEISRSLDWTSLFSQGIDVGLTFKF